MSPPAPPPPPPVLLNCDVLPPPPPPPTIKISISPSLVTSNVCSPIVLNSCIL